MAATPCMHEELKRGSSALVKYPVDAPASWCEEMAMAQSASQNEWRSRQILKAHHYDVRTSQFRLAAVLEAVPVSSVERVSYRLRQSIDLQVRRREKERDV